MPTSSPPHSDELSLVRPPAPLEHWWVSLAFFFFLSFPFYRGVCSFTSQTGFCFAFFVFFSSPSHGGCTFSICVVWKLVRLTIANLTQVGQNESKEKGLWGGGVTVVEGGVFLENVCFPVSNLVSQRACTVRAPIHETCCQTAWVHDTGFLSALFASTLSFYQDSKSFGRLCFFFLLFVVFFIYLEVSLCNFILWVLMCGDFEFPS